MKSQKVENSILLIIVIRAIFLLFFNKLSITDLIFGGILGLILIIIYQKLNLKKYTIFKLILLLTLIILSLATLNNVTYFIQNNILRNFSYLMIAIPFLALSIYIAIKGYHTYIKTIELSSYILITIFILSIIMLIPYIEPSNFTGFNYNLTTNFIDVAILILIIFIAFNYLNNYQINYKIYTFSIINIVFLRLLTTSILSNTLENVFDYPYISIFKKISYFEFLERLEGFLSMQYLFDYLFLLTLFTLTIKFLIFHLYKKDYLFNKKRKNAN